MVSRIFLGLIAGAALCTASAASAVVNIDFGSQPGNLGSNATYTSGGLTVTASGYSDGYNFSAPGDLYGTNLGGGEQGLGLVADPSGQDEIYWRDPNTELSHLGAFVELDVSGLFGLVSDAQFFMGSTTEGEQWIVYGSNDAGCGWFCGGPSVNGFDQDPHDLFAFGTYQYYDFYSLGTLGNGAPGNVLLGGLVLTPSAPEPGTWAMMLLGFGAVGLATRRNRKKLALTEHA